MKILTEIALISARILVENRSSEISDRKLPISDSVRRRFFLPSGNRQFPRGKNASIRNGLMGLKSAHFQEYDFRESDEVDRFLKIGTHFKRDRALLKTVFVLHGQAFVFYAQRIDTRCSGANL